MCPYCISGLYGRVAPVLSLFLVPLVPVAHGAQHGGRPGARHGGPAQRGRAAEGRCDRAEYKVYAQEWFALQRKSLVPGTVALQIHRVNKYRDRALMQIYRVSSIFDRTQEALSSTLSLPGRGSLVRSTDEWKETRATGVGWVSEGVTTEQ